MSALYPRGSKKHWLAARSVRATLTQSIKAAVAEASNQILTKARAGSNDFAQARAYVSSLYSSGKLDETQLAEFAEERSFDKVTAALSLMCDLPVGPVERALVQNETEQILVLAKAIDLSWVTTVR